MAGQPGTSQDFPDDDPFLLRHLPGRSPLMMGVRTRVHQLNTNERLARFILLAGETGTGKNHVARVIAGHRRWLGTRDADLVGAALPGGIGPLERYTERLGEKVMSVVTETLAESQLFGHVRGAFSDARKDYPGLFGDPGYDDILLDEIGEMSRAIQAKLLGVLGDGTFVPLGGTSRQRQSLSARILMATNRDLARMVQAGTFRQDLFFRVRRHVVVIPPLREHIEDLPAIAAAIIARTCARDAGRWTTAPRLSREDLAWASGQRWPGNVRELEELLEVWLVDGAERPLLAIADARPYADADDVIAGTADDVSAQVRELLEGSMDGSREAPGTLGQLVERFTEKTKVAVMTAVREWYRERRADRELIHRLFPGMTYESFKSQISRAGRR